MTGISRVGLRASGFLLFAFGLAACQTAARTHAGPAAVRTDGSYFSDVLADAASSKPPVRNAFRLYRDFEAVYVATAGEPEAVDQGSFRGYRDFGSGGCLLDGAHFDCRFVREEKAWALCGEALDDAVSLSFQPVGALQENPANCPQQDRRIFRFVPQR